MGFDIFESYFMRKKKRTIVLIHVCWIFYLEGLELDHVSW